MKHTQHEFMNSDEKKENTEDKNIINIDFSESPFYNDRNVKPYEKSLKNKNLALSNINDGLNSHRSKPTNHITLRRRSRLGMNRNELNDSKTLKLPVITNDSSSTAKKIPMNSRYPNVYNMRRSPVSNFYFDYSLI